MSLQSYASHLLAKSLIEMFPKIQLLDVGCDGILFFCEFEMHTGPDKQSLLLIEERMNQIIRSKPEFKIQEMMGLNVAGLFKDLNQKALAESLSGIKALVHVIRIGDYAGIFEGEPKEVDPKGDRPLKIKLVNLTLESGVYRIEGVAEATDSAVKEGVKIYSALKGNLQKSLGRVGNYFLRDPDSNWIFLEKALKFRELLKKTFIESDSYSVDVFHDTERGIAQALEKAGHTLGIKKIFTSKRSSDYLLTLSPFEEGEKSFNSSLQLIEKTARMFGFESQMVLGQLSPPDDLRDKQLRALWKSLSKKLAEWHPDKGSGHFEAQELGEYDAAGPFLQVFWIDPLKRRVMGPRINLVANDESTMGVLLQLFPEWDQLLLKLIECGSINSVESEIKKKLES